MKIYAKKLTIAQQIQQALDDFAVQLSDARDVTISIMLYPDSIRKTWFVGDSYRYQFTAKLTEGDISKNFQFSTYRKIDEPFNFCSDKSIREANDMLEGNSKWAVIQLSK